MGVCEQTLVRCAIRRITMKYAVVVVVVAAIAVYCVCVFFSRTTYHFSDPFIHLYNTARSISHAHCMSVFLTQCLHRLYNNYSTKIRNASNKNE